MQFSPGEVNTRHFYPLVGMLQLSHGKLLQTFAAVNKTKFSPGAVNTSLRRHNEPKLESDDIKAPHQSTQQSLISGLKETRQGDFGNYLIAI